jgi:hypothetical protein
LDLKEILPPLYLLSQKTPTPSFSQETQLNESLENFYRTSFHQLIVPRINGENVFREAFMKIRSLFVIDRGNHIQLLPNNPFLEGRMLNIQTENAAIDIEWTKGRLRRVTLYVRKTGDVFLELPKEILSFRVKMQLHERGTLQKRGDPLHCVAGARMYLDRFIRPLA